MPLTTGHRLGPYEILALIGAGGMGEVYKARDTRLDRAVAIKVLPEKLAQNPEYRQRLEREARAVAALNHPHICTLHDIGQQDGIDFLVFEYLEGETLAARLAKGPIPFEESLRYMVQVADALDKAHRKELTHRDLKPGNIMLTKAGAKLLDFGLAKTAARAPAGMTQLPTADAGLTVSGAILGTLHYMSPEQLQGNPVDARSDIFSFGVVLYEMATGAKAFPGTNLASVIAAILTVEPKSISVLDPMSPPALDRAVKKCLAKDPDDRWQSAADLGSQLQWLSESTVPSTPLAQRRDRKGAVLPWLVAATLAALLLAVTLFRRAPEPAETTRFPVFPPEKASFAGSFSLSPDGRRLACRVTMPDGTLMFALRSMDSLAARPLPGTEEGTYSFWSPDSRFLAFFAGGKLKKIDVAGGPAQTLCDTSGVGGAWTRDGVIIFGRPSGGLQRVAAEGGVPAPVTSLDASRQENAHLAPRFLPDGRHFLYLVRSTQREQNGIYVGSLDAKPEAQPRQRHVETDTQAEYVPDRRGGPGYLLFLREATLMAQPFDPAGLRLTGSAVPVAEQVGAVPYLATFSASTNGTLAYRSGAFSTQLAWFDREGRPLGPVGPLGDHRDPALSPDQQRVAFSRHDAGTADIWLLELARGAASRFTFHPALDSSSVWSPDGRRIVFASQRDGPGNLYVKLASGAGGEELLLKSAEQMWPVDWSSDGRFVLYVSVGPKSAEDLWVLPAAEGGAGPEGAPRKPVPFAQTQFRERQGAFSPDGRWIAYISDESGRGEVYVQASPGAASGASGKWQVSTTSGANPRWRPDGKELFYIAGRKMMTVDVKTAGSSFERGVPRPLFDVRTVFTPAVGNHFAVSQDGRRFLINGPAEETAVTPITVVMNWAPKN